ncbi:MAG: restriction endonuclease subunit S [Gemmatimonadetes bacterium]|nr:restriction endonuclease subunit S [Gemmatimonadota bacterium]
MTLDQLGSISRGRSRHRPRDAKFLYGGPFPFVQTGDVRKAGLYLRDFEQTYSEAGLAQSRLWPRGTLCITIAANIAETSILDIEACFPDSVIGFIAKPKRADARFVKYLFDATLKMKFRSFTQGAAQDNLSQAKLLSMKFPVPELVVQTEIADILSAYDDLIENNRRRIALLEEAARLLYREWFVHFRFPGHEQVKIIDSIPDGWTRRKLVKLAEVVMGQSPKSKFYNDVGDGLPFHQGVTDYGFRFVSHRTYSTAVTKLARAGDILVSVRAPVGRINITRDKIVLGRGLAAVRSRTERQSFLFYALKNLFYAENIIGTGAIYAATNKKELESQTLIEPAKKVLAEFDEQVRGIDQNIANLTTQNEKLSQARDLLLPRLMSEEIAV